MKVVTTRPKGTAAKRYVKTRNAARSIIRSPRGHVYPAVATYEASSRIRTHLELADRDEQVDRREVMIHMFGNPGQA